MRMPECVKWAPIPAKLAGEAIPQRLEVNKPVTPSAWQRLEVTGLEGIFDDVMFRNLTEFRIASSRGAR